MFNNRSRFVDTTEHKIADLDFSLNGFREQKVIYDGEAYAQMIKRLLLMRKGTYPSIPDMGIGISTYRFQDIDQLAAGRLSSDIRAQLLAYIPGLPLETIDISKAKYKGTYVLYIDIIISSPVAKKISFAYMQKGKSLISSSITVEKPKLITE
jgi:phage baseplate assembly protein W